MGETKLYKALVYLLARRMRRSQDLHQAGSLAPGETAPPLLDIAEPRRGIAEAAGQLTLREADGPACCADRLRTESLRSLQHRPPRPSPASSAPRLTDGRTLARQTEGMAMRGKKKQSARKQRKATAGMSAATSAASEWRLVEQVVASMHESEGVEVKRNVRMPSVHGGGSKREIDVLVTGNFAGYPMRVAIECKDYKRLIGANEIDAFVGKLPYVGMPTQQGIYVTTSGYTRDAIDHAHEAGIRLLTLRDLTQELPESVARAFQSSLYLLAVVEQVLFTTEQDHGPQAPHEWWVLFDERGQPWGMLPDAIYQAWLRGDIPSTMGTYTAPIGLPPGWHQLANGKPVTDRSITATVRVVGYLVTLSGTVTAHRLINAADQVPMKGHITARFAPDAASATLPVVTVQSDEELQELLAGHQEMVQVATRVRLPRIQFRASYWPPSQRVWNLIVERVRAFEAGEGPDPQTLSLEELEGDDLSAVFEPIAEGHPASPLFARHRGDASTRR
jgi:hypothetical protein